MKARRWLWVPVNAALAIHDEQISEHSGIPGIRDLASIESALDRPRKLVAYGKRDAATLAAAYAFGLCRNHRFFDGHNRTAYVVAETFLDLNGYLMNASDEQVVGTMLAVASGAMSQAQLAGWFRSFIAKSKDHGPR